MEKVLVIIPDSNKGKFIAKGFSSAFKDYSFFVIEKKIYDLNVEEIKNIDPDIIFAVWTDIKQSGELENFFSSYINNKTVIINFSEVLNDIPELLQKRHNSFCFSYDNTNEKNRVLPCVCAQDYKRKFKGYKYLLTFAGNPSFLLRERLLSKLIYNFGIINIFCRSYDFYKSVDDIYRQGLLNDKYIDLYRESYRGYVEDQNVLSYIYSASKVNIDMAGEKNKPVNFRCMEILASGGFLISPYSEVLAKTFEDGKEIETYVTDTELIDKIRFYISNCNLAQLIAAKGRKHVASNHSFCDRLKMILKVIYGKDSCN